MSNRRSVHDCHCRAAAMLSLMLLTSVAGVVSAADGTPDTTFSTNLGTGFNAAVNAVAVQGDGKIVVGGAFTAVNGVTSNFIARLNADGTRDTTFSTNLGTGFNAAVNAVAVQGDGKIVVGGDFTSLNGVSSNRIARLNATGAPDTAFSTNLGTGFSLTVHAVAVQGDGKIVVGGLFTTLNGVSSNRIARLNADGTRDATFTTMGTGFSSTVNAVAVQADGGIVLGGDFTALNGITTNRVARLQATGFPDATFNTNLGTGFNVEVTSIAVQGDGKIVVGGSFTTLNGVTSNRIARLNADGTPDSAFSTKLGAGFDVDVLALAVQGDGKIVAGGRFTTMNTIPASRLARLHTGGLPDTTFTSRLGTGFSTSVFAVASQRDGKIVVGGAFTTLNGATSNFLARLDAPVLVAGTPDTTFSTNLGTGFSDVVRAVAVQGDGKIVAGGAFTTLNGVSSNRIARVNADGTADTTFTANLGTGLSATAHTVAVQGDGKIVVGGEFTTLNGVSSNRIARVNADGTADTTFTTNLGTGFSGAVFGVALQGDGKIVVVGQFTFLNGVSSHRIARLNAGGSPDTAFTANLGSGFNVGVKAVAVQGDGKIVVGGFFTTLNGVSSNSLARLNADGTPDTTFSANLGIGFNAQVESVAVQGDGKIVVGGFFTTLNGVSSNRVARLNADGTPDTTFSTNLGAGFNTQVQSVTVLGDGKIVVGGGFSLYTFFLARLNADGTPDLNAYPLLNAGVMAVVVQRDGRIVVGGFFTTVNGVTSSHLVRIGVPLFADDPLQAGLTLIKALHLTELRQRIDDLRVRHGLSAFAWDETIVAGVTSTSAAHVAELRAALQEAYVAAGGTPPTYTDPVLVPGSFLIKAVHLTEIRGAVVAIW